MSGILPEGYTQLEYIKYIPSKTLLLKGFESQGQAIKRIEELQTQCPSSAYRVGGIAEQIIRGFFVELPEEAVKYLTDEEQKRLEDKPQIVQAGEYNPIVYRFIPEEFVNDFFTDGKLMLTTFKRCARLEDANRRDPTEGTANLTGKVTTAASK